MHYIASLFAGILAFILPHPQPVPVAIAPVEVQATTTVETPVIAAPVVSKKTAPAPAKTQLVVAPTPQAAPVIKAAPVPTQCPSGKELVYPKTGNPTCEWTAASSAAISSMQAQQAQKDADAAAKAEAKAVIAARSVFDSPMAVLVSACSGVYTLQTSVGISATNPCLIANAKLSTVIQQELITGISGTEKARQLAALIDEYDALSKARDSISIPIKGQTIQSEQTVMDLEIQAVQKNELLLQ